ncbi:Hypothetical predicted protein [Lecanosticta acicola]|uniref:Inosine/uridine-preferring nucleoside hydrolase domain-containing protein n=1 Tax=Lecanosticta acicola TaxID=111012 RepID=A0AAI8YWU4_9PEZI|nr:Hypothetical predicted protein [Lecanosticta acicola]
MSRKIIIDTDPGVDDVLALLLALAATPEELEILLISVTYGNIDVRNCLRNVISLFHHVEQEIEWRKSQGRDPGFQTLRKTKPIVAVGPDHPLAEQTMMADFFHGRDGLAGIHETHPHMTPADTWKSLFDRSQQSSDPEEHAVAEELANKDALFIPSKKPSSEEILRLLRDNEPDTITIVAIGPLTNLALAAAQDPETFLRAKEIVVMGGNINDIGNVCGNLSPSSTNIISAPEPLFRLTKQPTGPIRTQLNSRNQITPVAEFNTFADSIAAARVYALSSQDPKTTMPPPIPPTSTNEQTVLRPYPETLSRQLKITMFPVDITHRHNLSRGVYRTILASPSTSNSPLASWLSAFLTSTFRKIESLQQEASGDDVNLGLHDPLTIWYCMTDPATWQINEDEDIRIETSGQWTRGMCVVDRRTRRKRAEGEEGEKAGDTGNWLSRRGGNRLRRAVRSPAGGEEGFGGLMLRRILNME